jgi:hypothetical protein
MMTRSSLIPLTLTLAACSSAGASGGDAGPQDSQMSHDGADSMSDAKSSDARNDSPSDATPDAAPAACSAQPNTGLSLGTVTASATSCDNGAATGASCTAVSVSCYPSIESQPLTGQIAVSDPSGTIKGTITTHNGGAGTAYDGAQAMADFVTPYTSAGYRFVQIKWDSSWQVGALGNNHSACYVATLYQWIFENVHKSDRTTGFCGQGTSGGSASLAYSMTQYGLDALFDYTMLVAGPAVTRMDLGCDIASWNGKQPSPAMCASSLPAVVFPLPASAIDGMEDTTTCDCSNQPSCVSSSDLAKWTDDSTVSATARYSYPNTSVGFFMCGNWPAERNDAGVEIREAGVTNGSTLGAYYYAALASSGVTNVSAHCFGGPSGPESSCEQEGVFMDPNAFNDAVTTMKSECTPRHTSCGH